MTAVPVLNIYTCPGIYVLLIIVSNLQDLKQCICIWILEEIHYFGIYSSFLHLNLWLTKMNLVFWPKHVSAMNETWAKHYALCFLFFFSHVYLSKACEVTYLQLLLKSLNLFLKNNEIYHLLGPFSTKHGCIWPLSSRMCLHPVPFSYKPRLQCPALTCAAFTPSPSLTSLDFNVQH